MKDKKGAIELSMSTIVVVVIAIVLLSLGIVFVRKIMGDVTGTAESAFEAADKEIQDLMGGDDTFYLSGPGHDIKVGDEKSISGGIQNFLGENMEFKIKIETDKENYLEWIQAPPTVFVLAGEKEPFVITVRVPKTAKAGITTFYTIFVYDENDEVYESGQLAINVK